MRVMISQPMAGLTKDEIRKNRVEVVALLESQGHEIVDTILEQNAPEGLNAPLWYLGKSLQAIAAVDAVYFLNGWKEEVWNSPIRKICELHGIKTMRFLCEANGGLPDFYPCTICGKHGIVKRVHHQVFEEDICILSYMGVLEIFCDDHRHYFSAEVIEKYISINDFCEFMEIFRNKKISELPFCRLERMRLMAQNFIKMIEEAIRNIQ